MAAGATTAAGDTTPVRWLEPMPDVRARTVLIVALAGFGLVMAAVMTFGTPSLRTSDDAEMMAAVSGYDGGARRPELLFTSVLIGRVLVALYDAVPAAPWYGIYLHGMQLVALVAITLSTAALLRGSPRTVVAAVGGALLLTAANAMMAVQFTIVGILLALAGGLSFMALRATGRGPLTSGAAGGLLLWLAFLVRVQAFGLGLLLIGIVVLVRAVVRREADVMCWIALTAIAGALISGSALAEQRWWMEELGQPRPMAQFATGLTGGSGFLRDDAGPLSDNDRALMQNWLIYPSQMFAYEARSTDERPKTHVADGNEGGLGVTQGSRLSPLIALGRAPGAILQGSLRAMTMGWWVLLIAAGVIAAAGTRRDRAAGILMAGAGVLLLGAVGVTRLPDRVALPMLLGILIGTAVVTTSNHVGRTRVPPPRQAGLAAWSPVAAVAVAALPWLMTTLALSEEASWRRERAEIFLDELAALPGDPIVVLWLIDAWHALHPLGWDQASKYPVDAVQLAGWQYLLPYRETQRVDLGLTDWIGAVADRDDVLLVAEAERVELLQTLLRERRGRLCTSVESDGTVRGGRELLVRRIRDIPCQGEVVLP